MAKPLRSDDPSPKSVQFSQFGVLDDKQRSTKSFVVSITVNVTIAALIVILGYVAKNNPVIAKKLTAIALPPKPPEAPKPIPKPPKPPPPPLPKPPVIKEEPKPLPEPPKPMPEPPKPVPVPVAKPVPTPPQPKAPPAPVAVKLNNFAAPHKVDPPAASRVALGASAASMPNHDLHPSAVRLGNSAVNPTGPAVATRVNMGGGMPGMNASNTGNGPHASAVNLGSGNPNGSAGGHGNPAATPVAGLSNGYGRPGGHGAGGAAPVNVGGFGAPQHVAAQPVQAKTATAPPSLIYRPEPAYTPEARAAHIEGNVQVRIRVLTNGTVQFVSIVHGLGYGLDAQARRVVEGMRFKPSMDASGQPTEWTGDVIVRFHMS